MSKITATGLPLSVTIDPTTVQITTGTQQASYTNFTITITNTGKSSLSINAVSIVLPENLVLPGTLTTIIAGTDSGALWSFGQSAISELEFDASPQSPGTYVTIHTGDIYNFTLSMVTLVNTITLPNALVNVIFQMSDGSKSASQLPVNLISALASVVFKSEPADIDPHGSAELIWQSTGINHCVINPINEPGLPASGTYNVSPASTTIYSLYAYGTGVILGAQWTVSLKIPAINGFISTTAATSVNYNDMITLSWSCNDYVETIEMTNDTGINIPALLTGANTAQSGNITVGPLTKETNFTLVACKSNPTVCVQQPCQITINNVSAQLNYSQDAGMWEGDDITLTWEIVSPISVSISPALPNGPSLTNLSGSATINPFDDITYVLTVNGLTDNVAGTVTSTAAIKVKKVAANNPFSVAPDVIIVPDSNDPNPMPNQVTLSWDMIAEVVTIDQGIGPVQTKDTHILKAPLNGAVYNLTAGTKKNPALFTQQVIVQSNYGPFYFVNFVSQIVQTGSVNITEAVLLTSSITPILFNKLYNVIITNLSPVSGPPPATYIGQFSSMPTYNGINMYSIKLFSIENGQPMGPILNWTNPYLQLGSITVVSEFIVPGS